MSRKAVTGQNSLVQATVFKKCDRSNHKPGSNKGCAAGTCQHTCEPAQVADCAHKWTVRYSVNSRQREQSFGTLTEAQTFQLTLSTGKQTQGAMFVDPRAGIVEFLPLCDAYIEGMAKANAKSKATYRSNFGNPAVTKLLQGRSVLEVARMDAEVKTLLNKTLGSYSDDYRGNVRRIITGTLDECVRRGTIPRHTLSGIELASRIVTAEQYEQQNKGMVCVDDDTVRMLADGIAATGQDKQRPQPHARHARPGHRPMASAHDGTADQGSPGSPQGRFQGARRRNPLPASVLAGQRERPGARALEAPQGRRVPRRSRSRHGVGHGCGLPDGPLCPGPSGTPYMPYSTARNRFGRMLDYLGISGAHTHSLRHQFASEALDANPRELANISQVLGHD